MRILTVALIAFAVVLTLGFVGVTQNSVSAPQQFAAHAAVLTLPRAASPRIMSALRDQGPLQFCGQCTGDSDCGTGHKCCGPSSCLECFKVVTCP